MKVNCVWEHNGDDSILYANNFVGAFSRGASKEETAAFVIDFITRTLNTLSENIIEQYGNIPIVYAGGVMSCSIIQKKLSKFGSFAAPQFSADNAAGIALLARNSYFNS